jgi:hypothetical protein
LDEAARLRSRKRAPVHMRPSAEHLTASSLQLIEAVLCNVSRSNLHLFASSGVRISNSPEIEIESFVSDASFPVFSGGADTPLDSHRPGFTVDLTSFRRPQGLNLTDTGKTLAAQFPEWHQRPTINTGRLRDWRGQLSQQLSQAKGSSVVGSRKLRITFLGLPWLV